MKQPLVLRFCLLVFVLSCGKDPVDPPITQPPTTTTPDPITKKNTISTTTNPAPNISGKPGETVAVVKLKGTSLKGTPIYDIEEEDPNDTGKLVSGASIDSIYYQFDKDGNAKLFQSLESPKTVEGNTTYTAEKVDKITNLEAQTPLVLNETALQDFLNEAVLGTSSITLTDLFGTEIDLNNLSLNITPSDDRLIQTEIKDGKLICTYPDTYRANDLTVSLSATLGDSSLDRTLYLDHGILLDTSDRESLKRVIIDHYSQMARTYNTYITLYKFTDVYPKVYLDGGTETEKEQVTFGMNDFDQALRLSGATLPDGSPMRLDVVETPEEANFFSFVGTRESFQEKYDRTAPPHAGGVAPIFKNGDQETGELVGGITFADSETHALAKISLHEATAGLGLNGERVGRTSINSDPVESPNGSLLLPFMNVKDVGGVVAHYHPVIKPAIANSTIIDSEGNVAPEFEPAFENATDVMTNLIDSKQIVIDLRGR